LFSGVGSFGIECLSRGVNKVIFVENYDGALTVLKKNLSDLRSVKNYEILQRDIYGDELFSKFNDRFNIIFLDPPYKDKNLENLLIKIKNSNILKKNGIIILHRHKNEKDLFDSNFQILEEKKYGISKIIFAQILN